MSELTDFLTARLDEDEQMARTAADYAARYGDSPSWRWLRWERVVEGRNPNTGEDGPWVRSGGWVTPMESADDIAPLEHGQTWESELGEHVARHDPSRALRQVAAMRAIVEALTTATRAERVSTARRGIYEWHYVTGPLDDQAEVVLTHLAAIWSDHPDYQEVWKP